jgi:hypothetical protein
MTDDLSSTLAPRYRYANRSGTVVHKIVNGAILAVGTDQPDVIEPYVHTPEVGLAEAREIVAKTVPLGIRASMQSFATKLMIQQNQAEMAVHFPKFAALDMWEDDMLEAGKNNTPWPPAPEWLLEYIKDF